MACRSSTRAASRSLSGSPSSRWWCTWSRPCGTAGPGSTWRCCTRRSRRTSRSPRRPVACGFSLGLRSDAVKRKKDEVRLYVVSDFHASDRAWRKMLNAIRLGVYKADAVLYCGDLTGKAIVPIVEDGDRFEAELLGTRRVARTDEQLMDLERDVSAMGYYPFRTTHGEVDSVVGDPGALGQLFADKIRTQVSDWMA